MPCALAISGNSANAQSIHADGGESKSLPLASKRGGFGVDRKTRQRPSSCDRLNRPHALSAFHRKQNRLRQTPSVSTESFNWKIVIAQSNFTRTYWYWTTKNKLGFLRSLSLGVQNPLAWRAIVTWLARGRERENLFILIQGDQFCFQFMLILCLRIKYVNF